MYQRKNDRQKRLGLALIPELSGKRGMVLQGFELSLGKTGCHPTPEAGSTSGSRRGQREVERCIGSSLELPDPSAGSGPGAGRHASGSSAGSTGRPGPSSPRSRHHPAHDVAAVDVHDDVEVVIAPLLRPEQPRDIPGTTPGSAPWPSTRASCTRDGCAAPGVPETGTSEARTRYIVRSLHR